MTRRLKLKHHNNPHRIAHKRWRQRARHLRLQYNALHEEDKQKIWMKGRRMGMSQTNFMFNMELAQALKMKY